MTRRLDTSAVGDAAEAEVQRLLELRGFSVVNLNETRTNHPTYDLLARSAFGEWRISVKCARAKRDVSLGPPRSIRRLETGSLVFILLPTSRDHEIDISAGNYELWIVPSDVVVRDALDAHAHYWAEDSEALERNTVRIKDKKDAHGGRSKSGDVFSAWGAAYRDAWHLLQS